MPPSPVPRGKPLAPALPPTIYQYRTQTGRHRATFFGIDVLRGCSASVRFLLHAADAVVVRIADPEPPLAVHRNPVWPIQLGFVGRAAVARRAALAVTRGGRDQAGLQINAANLLVFCINHKNSRPVGAHAKLFGAVEGGLQGRAAIA